MELQPEGLVSTRCTRDKLGGGRGENKILKNVSVTEPESSLCWDTWEKGHMDKWEKQKSG